MESIEVKKHPGVEWGELFERYSIIPLVSRRKQALGSWKQYQTTRATTDDLERWAFDAQALNVGVITGAISGLVVLDLDNDDAAAEAERRGLPHTVAVTTPRGHHFYFAHPGATVNNIVGQEGGKLPEGIDLRGDGGYVVGPGSYFVPTPGELCAGKAEGKYRWADGCSPSDVALAPMPDWLVEAIESKPNQTPPAAGQLSNPVAKSPNNPPPDQPSSRAQRYAATALAGEVERITNAPPGSSNDTLVRSAYAIAQLVAAGALAEWEAREAITDAAAARNIPCAEAAATIASGWAKGLMDPRRNLPEEKPTDQRNTTTDSERPPTALKLLCAADSYNTSVPPRSYLIDQWLPSGATTGLFGDGGTGKSLVAMMMATAIAAGKDLWGNAVTQAPTLGIYCEDDANELTRRQQSINASLGLSPDDLRHCYWSSRFGEQSLLGASSVGGAYEPNELYAAIRAAALDRGARLIVLDNISMIYGDNINDPSLVTRFMSQMNRLALDINGAVLLVGHTAKAEGSKFAGTMAWSNASRNRLLFARPEGAAAARNPDLRVLSRDKSNYAQAGTTLEVCWHHGAFVSAHVNDTGAPAANPKEVEQNNAFLQHLSRLTSDQQALSTKRNASNYAPKVMATTTTASGTKYKQDAHRIDMERAMGRLLSAGVIADDQSLGWQRSRGKEATGLKLVSKGAVEATLSESDAINDNAAAAAAEWVDVTTQTNAPPPMPTALEPIMQSTWQQTSVEDKMAELKALLSRTKAP